MHGCLPKQSANVLCCLFGFCDCSFLNTYVSGGVIVTTSVMGPLKILPLLILAASVVSEDLYDSIINLSKYDLKYTGQHDIVNIILPLTRYNSNVCDVKPPPPVVFFVQADIIEGGIKYQGLYVLKNGTATEVLRNGRDATALDIENKKIYIGASDGIYIYDDTDGTTSKYGNITDNIVRIETDESTGTVYFITHDYKVFAVADGGTKKIEIKQFKGVKDMTIDLDGNYYYNDIKNDLYVLNEDGAKKFVNIPRGKEIKLSTSVIANKVIVYAMVDDKLYALNSNGTHKESPKNPETYTAFAADAGLKLYHAIDRKIYELDMTKSFCAQRNVLMYFMLGDPRLRELLSNNPFFG